MPAAPPGRVVVLNGTSSAGKSTLLAALQDRWPVPLVDLGLDRHLTMLPRRYVGAAWPEVFRYELDDQGAIARVLPGPVGHRLVRAMHRAAAAVAGSGLDVVLDHVLLDPAWVLDLAESLAGLHVTTVGVRCPLAVVCEREAARGNRTLGQAAAQYPYVHAHIGYDVDVDTSRLSPQQGANAVIVSVHGGTTAGRRGRG